MKTDKLSEALRGKKYKLVPTAGKENEYESDVVYVPDFELLLKDLNRTLQTFEGVLATEETIKDPTLREVYTAIRNQRNILRTHMRKNYPIEYQQIKGLFEGGYSVGAGAEVGTPFAFEKTKPQELPEANPGASLGKGPKAGSKGVTNNYYTKNFKYKLVNPEKLAAQSKAVDTKYLWGK